MLKRLLATVAAVGLLTTEACALPLGGNPSSAAPPADQMAACLATMATNTWKDASTCVATNSTVRAVAWNCTAQPCSSNGQPGTPSDAPTTASLIGGADVSGVMTDWGGGTYDSDDKMLIVWGGGHLGYYGNELYGFSLPTLQWQRLSVPSSLNGFTKGGNAFTMPDGNPIAPHTYNGLDYVSGTGLFQLATAGNDLGNSSNQSWKQTVSGLSPTAYNHWAAISGIPNVFLGQISGLDPSSSKLYVWGGFASVPIASLSSPYTGAWVSTGGNAINNGTTYTGAIQPGVQFVAAGANASTTSNFLAANISTGNEITRAFIGDASIPNCGNPGFVWDATVSQFIGWCGGKNIATLNPSTYVFTLVTVGGTVTPSCTDAHCTSATGVLSEGVFGRFQCLRPVYSACIAVNTVDDHVFIYKF